MACRAGAAADAPPAGLITHSNVGFVPSDRSSFTQYHVLSRPRQAGIFSVRAYRITESQTAREMSLMAGRPVCNCTWGPGGKKTTHDTLV
jgi:hypothetical protein